MLDIKIDEAAGYIELTVDGAIDSAGYEAAVAAIEALLKTHKKINAVEVVRSFAGMEPSLWWRDLNYSFSRLDSFGRCAVVTDNDFLAEKIAAEYKDGTIDALVASEAPAALPVSRSESRTRAAASGAPCARSHAAPSCRPHNPFPGSRAAAGSP